MNDSGLVFRVVDWDGRYETARSLKKSGPLAEVAVSTDLVGGAIARLLTLPDSAATLGVWYFIQALAANCERRGALTNFGAPLTTEELARLSGWDVPLIERTLTILSSPEIGLLEQVPRDEALRPPVIPEPPPRQPRRPKPLLFTHCPVCNADLVALAEKEHSHQPDEPCGCPNADCAERHANAGSVGHVANAASVRGEVPSAHHQQEPLSVTPKPPPVARSDNRLQPRRKKRPPKPKRKHLNRR